MKILFSLLALLGTAQLAVAQNPDDYRGGWRTESGEPHTYQFSIRGDLVRGIYCTLCSDATTLAFIDGKFGTDGITFVVTHVKADSSTAYQDRATAKFDKRKLIVTGTSGGPGGGKFQEDGHQRFARPGSASLARVKASCGQWPRSRHRRRRTGPAAQAELQVQPQPPRETRAGGRSRPRGAEVVRLSCSPDRGSN